MGQEWNIVTILDERKYLKLYRTCKVLDILALKK